VSLGEKDHPALPDRLLAAGGREETPSHHLPGGGCQQITAWGRRLWKGKAEEAHSQRSPGRLQHFGSSVEQLPPLFCAACPADPHLSLVPALYQEPSFLHDSGRNRQGWRCGCVSIGVCVAGSALPGVGSHTGKLSLGQD